MPEALGLIGPETCRLIVMSHIRETWAMPEDLEEYLKLYDEADRVDSSIAFGPE
jgi:hypothetical protein